MKMSEIDETLYEYSRQFATTKGNCQVLSNNLKRNIFAYTKFSNISSQRILNLCASDISLQDKTFGGNIQLQELQKLINFVSLNFKKNG